MRYLVKTEFDRIYVQIQTDTNAGTLRAYTQEEREKMFRRVEMSESIPASVPNVARDTQMYYRVRVDETEIYVEKRGGK